MKLRAAFSRFFFAASLAACACAQAAVTVSEAWVRGTVPAQRATGAFLTLQSSDDATLVAITSPAAQTVEIHASEMRQGMMHMHAVDGVALPAGKRVALEPGGFHVMLIGLRRPLAAGDSVPLTLTVRDKQGRSSRVEVRAAVRALGQ